MFIKSMLSQSRRDFQAIYECEHCGKIEKKSGYDDANFHENVIPQIRCGNCGGISDGSHEPHVPRYPEGVQL